MGICLSIAYVNCPGKLLLLSLLLRQKRLVQFRAVAAVASGTLPLGNGAGRDDEGPAFMSAGWPGGATFSLATEVEIVSSRRAGATPSARIPPISSTHSARVGQSRR